MIYTMVRRVATSFCVALAFGGVTCYAAQPSSSAPVAQIEPSRALAGPIRIAERATVSLAEAMPEDKYAFAPEAKMFTAGRTVEFAGVRTFAEQVAHVASSNYEYLQAMGVQTDRDPAAVLKLTSKSELVQALKDSYAAAGKAVAAFTVANVFEGLGTRKTGTRAAYAAAIAWHSMDHYGQMVEYARMNGVVPPESKR